MAITNLVAFLLMFLRAVSTSEYLGIDCGSANSYIDDSGIKWVGDGAYVQSGESHTAKNSPVSSLLSTLRVFKSKNKNCYNIPGFQGIKVLLRALFYYGNYDSNSSPPFFHLLFDGNKWTTVQNENDNWKYYDIIYVPKRQNISVCLAQINPDQFPFISGLEVWSLDSNMYNQIDSSRALILKQRYAFGSGDGISFLTDPYQRYWFTSRGNGLVSVSNRASSVDVTQTKDQVPLEVMLNAVATPSTNSNLLLSTAGLPSIQEVPIYLNMYFTEVQNLSTSSDLRRFIVMIDNKVIDAVNPAYQTAVETTYANINASSNTPIVLAATSDSTLPPLISGLELFTISDPLSNSTTNMTDVEGLASLQEGFPVLKEWSGDPCLPAEYPWDWVSCTNETTPRITSLLLSGYNLFGPLPNFSSLDALQTISSENPYLCNITCPKPPSEHHIQKWLVGVLSSVIPTLFAAAVLAAGRYWCKCSKSRKEKAKPTTGKHGRTQLRTRLREGMQWTGTAQNVAKDVARVTTEQFTNSPDNGNAAAAPSLP
ncbi:Malectin-like domain [Dillenia turbinata]|uniref:Malectin-like domain n=1 Tax=Dillenia turbinata TaxID=194707 RepID=A0AAN8Z6N2_9MAGN